MFMRQFYASRTPDITDVEIRRRDAVRTIAGEGMVLLENDGVLPLVNPGCIALYGNGARHTIKGGTGSGEVNSRPETVINVEHGLERAGFTVTTKKWLDAYDQCAIREATRQRQELIQAIANGESPIKLIMESKPTAPVFPRLEECAEDGQADIAIYVLARTSGEGKDRYSGTFDYELDAQEQNLLLDLTKRYSKVIVVLNVGGVIDTQFLRNTAGINAVLLMGQAGACGGDALADVLTGKISPSGKLTTTWAERYEDYPSAATFAGASGNLDDEEYSEDI